MNSKPSYLSRDGLDKLREELEVMVNVRRSEVAARIHEAKAHGDLSENAEYEDAKNEQAMLEQRIASLQDKLRRSIVIDEKKVDTEQVAGALETALGDA